MWLSSQCSKLGGRFPGYNSVRFEFLSSQFPVDADAVLRHPEKPLGWTRACIVLSLSIQIFDIEPSRSRDYGWQCISHSVLGHSSISQLSRGVLQKQLSKYIPNTWRIRKEQSPRISTLSQSTIKPRRCRDPWEVPSSFCLEELEVCHSLDNKWLVGVHVQATFAGKTDDGLFKFDENCKAIEASFDAPQTLSWLKTDVSGGWMSNPDGQRCDMFLQGKRYSSGILLHDHM